MKHTVEFEVSNRRMSCQFDINSSCNCHVQWLSGPLRGLFQLSELFKTRRDGMWNILSPDQARHYTNRMECFFTRLFWKRMARLITWCVLDAGQAALPGGKSCLTPWKTSDARPCCAMSGYRVAVSAGVHSVQPAMLKNSPLEGARNQLSLEPVSGSD